MLVANTSSLVHLAAAASGGPPAQDEDPLRLARVWEYFKSLEGNPAPEPYNISKSYSSATDAFIMSWYAWL
jgi:hypothetical protein